MNILTIRPLKISDETAFALAIEEFLNDDSDFEFAFQYDKSKPFTDYVDMLDRWSRGIDIPEKFVPNSYLVGLIGNKIVGRVSIRHVLNDYLGTVGGHIGYGVVPSERKNGYGTQMLRLSLPIAAALGIHRMLVTCDDDNLGSRKIIENNNGVFEDSIQDPNSFKTKRRYWIENQVNVCDEVV